MSDKKLSFISFYDEGDVKREGFFEIILDNGLFVKFKTSQGNVITIPYHRLLKIKERGVNDGLG
jgi:uncharacterized protein (UPF0248 family)